MLTREEFVEFILSGEEDSGPAAPEPGGESALPGAFGGFGFDEKSESSASAKRTFAQSLLEASGFGPTEFLPRESVILGDNPAARSLPDRVAYWPKTADRPYQTLLFELPTPGSELLRDSLFRDLRRETLLEDALHRLVQHSQTGFAKGGEKRTAAVKQGRPEETLILVSVPDDRSDAAVTNLVCFGTVSSDHLSMETFLISDEPRHWAPDNRPLAEDHLSRIYYRHFSKLASERWQDAFLTGKERELARALLEVCTEPVPNRRRIESSSVELVKEIAKSFGRGYQSSKLQFEGLPKNHFVGADPTAAKKKGFENHFQGMTVRDDRERLLGYVIYCLDEKEDADNLRALLAAHNSFHNVLVVYPDGDHAAFELWQGRRPLKGKLTKQGAQFEGEGEIVNLLSRFFVVSKSWISSPAELARELAYRAQYLKILAEQELEAERKKPAGDDRPVLDLYEIFDKALARQTESEFADSYAQALTYGLLAARWISRDASKPFTPTNLEDLLPSTSPFLKDLFKKLLGLKKDDSSEGTNYRFTPRLWWLIEDLISLLHRTSVREVFSNADRDPAIHFYEDFLDEYDPQIRKDRGVYYTPDEVVSYIVRTAHSALKERFDLPLGLADTTSWAEFSEKNGVEVPEGVDPREPFVQILDPATGTGTFLLRVVEVVHETMLRSYKERGLSAESAAKEWRRYVRSHLLLRLNGFELMMAPYIVTHMRLGLALQETGFEFEDGDRLRVFLVNTLEMHTSPQLSLLGEHVAEEARESEAVKRDSAMTVLVGNPPYERESATSPAERKGGWILSGWSGWRDGRPLIEDFDEITREAGAGGSIQATRNLYYYFWRWAAWRGFDSRDAPAIVSFITASSYLRGPGFAGMRGYVRENCDDVYILDLEGDQRGTRVTSNVFAITIPVCIGTLVRDPRAQRERAAVHYLRVAGTREEKLQYCQGKTSFTDVDWVKVSLAGTGPLMAAGSADYGSWPLVTDLFPIRFTGYHFYRTWPIEVDPETLNRRWEALVGSDSERRRDLFKETRDRKITKRCAPLDGSKEKAPAVATLTARDRCPEPSRTSFRSFDRQWCLADTRLGDFIRPSLWQGWSDKQVYLTSLFSGVLGTGPGATAAAFVPDCHHFRGSYGGKDIIPLWRDASARAGNISSGLESVLAETFSSKPKPEQVFAYAYAVLANPGYVARFEDELQVPGSRLPITREKHLFEQGADLGSELLRWHTYGERFNDKAGRFEVSGSAAVARAIPNARDEYPSRHRYDPEDLVLSVGAGAIAPVSREVWEFSVSGLQVVKSWLDYRMKDGSGRKSSPLDDIRPARWTEEMTRELLELLWVLEWTSAQYPRLDAWLDEVLESELVSADEVPTPTEAERTPPKVQRESQQQRLV